MTDIVNSVSVSSAQIITTESSESFLKPGVRDAIDIMFPKSAAQHLQNGIPCGAEAFVGINGSKESMFPVSTDAGNSIVSTAILPCSMTTAHVTTTTTTNTVTVALTEVVTTASASLSTCVTAESPSEVPHKAETKGSNQDAEAVSEKMHMEVQKNALNEVTVEVQKNAEGLKVINPCVLLDDDSQEKTSKSATSLDLSSSECHSRHDSDSEDMMRPFASIAREKKRHKKKKQQSASIIPNNLLSEVNVKSIGLKPSSECSPKISLSSISTSDVTSSVSLTDLGDSDSNTRQPIHKSVQEQLLHDNSCTERTSHGDCQISVLENGPLARKELYQNSDISTEEVSNISFSSVKENLHSEWGKLRQRLPEIDRLYFNVRTHRKKIKSSFPACYVVLKKIRAKSRYDLEKDNHLFENVLPLSVRLQHLSSLCDKGFVKCKQRKVPAVTEELVYRNIFEETVLLGSSDDEIENSRRRRNLRKRDKNISYVEPSEDDILDEYSRKRSRAKHKETTQRSDDEGKEDAKRSKKQISNSKSMSSDKGKHISCLEPLKDNTVDELSRKRPQTKLGEHAASIEDGGPGAPKKRKTQVVSGSDNVALITVEPNYVSNQKKLPEKTPTKKLAGTNKKKVSPEKTNNTNDTGTKLKEIIVYPPSNVTLKNSYCLKPDGTDVSISSSKEKDKNITKTSSSNCISILPASTLPGTFTHQQNPVTLFTSLPLRPRGLPTQPMVAGAAISSPVSTSSGVQKSPQYCFVKMDGKDVLLQLVPSGGVGVPVPMIMPKGKTMLVPSSPLLGQPLRQTLGLQNSVQAVTSSVPSVVTVSSAAQSLFGIPVIRPTNPQNISLAPLPVISAPQPLIPGLNSTASIRPLTLTTPGTFLTQATSGTYLAQSPGLGLAAPVSNSPVNSGNTLPATSVVSCIQSTQVMPAATATLVTVPNTTTGVQNIHMSTANLRAVAPNQTGSIRSFRIFVPGCTATGTASHFATLGSIANSSPLTHLAASSTLLPQRHQSSDKKLTPEQRLAKRKKLEKKYPLPPGVIIKTEPIETESKPSQPTSSARSLLTQKLRFISASGPRAGFHSFRIIHPTLANALTASGGTSNIIYRASSAVGGQTVLVHPSLGHIPIRANMPNSVMGLSSITPISAASLQPTTVATNVPPAVTTTMNNAAETVCINSLSTNALLSPVCSTGDASPHQQVTLTPNIIATSGNTTELLSNTATTQASVLSSSETSATINGTATSCEPASDSSSSKAPFEVLTVESLKTSVEELRKMIQIQEARGLKGERLKKLKDLLAKKEEHYNEMQNLSCLNTSFFSVSDSDGDINESNTTENVDNDREENTLSLDVPGGSETDPFVID